MTGAERFKPYRRGISKQEIVDYLVASDTIPTSRDHLPKRTLQMEAASRQRRLDTAMRRPHRVLATHATGPNLHQHAVASSSAPETSTNHESQHGGINPTLLQAVESHGQHPDVALSSSSGASSSDQESSDRESSPDPFELTNRPQSADQIEFGDEELIDLASHGTTSATAAVVDATQQNLYLSLLEGVDVFAPASVAFDPPTPILAPDISFMTEEVGNPNDEDPNIGERVQNSTTIQPELQVVERLDKLITLQSQILCVNLLTFGMLFQVRSTDSDSPTIHVPKN